MGSGKGTKFFVFVFKYRHTHIIQFLPLVPGTSEKSLKPGAGWLSVALVGMFTSLLPAPPLFFL